MVSIVRTLKPVKKKGQLLRATFGRERVKTQRILDRHRLDSIIEPGVSKTRRANRQLRAIMARE